MNGLLKSSSWQLLLCSMCLLVLTAFPFISPACKTPAKIVVIEGEEDTSGALHMVVYNVPRLPDDTFTAPVQPRIDEINLQGGFVVVAHPGRMGFTNEAELLQLDGYLGIELLDHNDSAKWDAVLTGRIKTGEPLPWGFMSDDFHYPFDLGQRFVMVQADGLSENALYDALRRGSFYWGTAPLIEEISVREGDIKVTSTDEVGFKVIGSDGKVMQETTGTVMEYAVAGSEGYVRLELMTPEGQVAGTQPFIINNASSVGSPYLPGSNWYKSNLHTHTTDSDGLLSRQAVIDAYREAGYSFLAITDHAEWEIPVESEGMVSGWIDYAGTAAGKVVTVGARVEGASTLTAVTTVTINGPGRYDYAIPYVPDGTYMITGVVTVSGAALPLTAEDILISGFRPVAVTVKEKQHVTGVHFTVTDFKTAPSAAG
jgi:hypothetical protein